MPFAGAIDKQLSAHRDVDGVLSTNGNLASVTAHKRALSGILSFAGDLSAAVSKISVGGLLALFGKVTLLKNGVPVGVAKAITLTIGRFNSVVVDTVKRWIRI